MGDLYYGSATAGSIQIPDRLLAHLKVAMTTKLRRGESFTLSWKLGEDGGDGRTTLWLHPAIDLRFVFDAADPESLDIELLQDLVRQADTNSGITLDLAKDIHAVPELEPAA
jgi:hypothetical protein